MNDELIDVRTPLAVSEGVRVEVGRDGHLHVVLEMLTLHLDRAHCERLTTTLARAMVRLHKIESTRPRPSLRVVRDARNANDARDEHEAPDVDTTHAPVESSGSE